MTKTASGNFFEDFTLGREILHPTPRTVTEADATLYLALTGPALRCTARRPWRAWPGCPGRPWTIS
jgi:2-methylfumaryl-CoA hydratase